MKKFKMILASLLTAVSMALVPMAAGAVTVLPQCTNGSTAVGATTSSAVCASKGDDVTHIIQNVVNILLFVVGAISVIMLIYGGIRYATSAGNAASVTAAKNTIVYALIGLVVALLAYAIVHFVIIAVTTGQPS